MNTMGMAHFMMACCCAAGPAGWPRLRWPGLRRWKRWNDHWLDHWHDWLDQWRDWLWPWYR